MSEIELAEGDIVETFKGASFWGRLISIERVDPAKPGGTVLAIAPGFEGTKHVYPLSQLRRRVSPLSGDGWQGIETGQDGRRVDVLLTNGTVKYGVRWGEDEDAEYGDIVPGWVDDATGKFVRGEDEVFTHWRPSALPPPPTDEVK